MKNHIVISVLIILITSCSSPLDKPYEKNSFEEDIIELKKTLSEEEYGMLEGYIYLNQFGGKDMAGETYGSLLKAVKKMKEEIALREEEERKLAEKAKIEEAERFKRLGDALTVSLSRKISKNTIIKNTSPTNLLLKTKQTRTSKRSLGK